jgi:hypothetical protein
VEHARHSEEARSHAWAKATTRYYAFEADATRAERIRTQQQKQAMEHRENEVWADVYSPSPQISAQQIAVDPAFNGNPERRKQMIELINNPPGSALPAAQSYQAALSLLDRLRRPDGDPQKIIDVGPIYDAAVGGKLNKSDFEFVKKEFDAIRTPGGEIFAKRKGDLIKRVTPFITKSNPLNGKLDWEGEGQLYNFEWAIYQKIDEYRKASKNPQDLLDPTKPDFVGRPEFLSQFQTRCSNRRRRPPRLFCARAAGQDQGLDQRPCQGSQEPRPALHHVQDRLLPASPASRSAIT